MNNIKTVQRDIFRRSLWDDLSINICNNISIDSVFYKLWGTFPEDNFSIKAAIEGNISINIQENIRENSNSTNLSPALASLIESEIKN